MTVGNTVGGRLAERWPMRTIAGGMAVASLAMGAFTVTAYSVAGALITLFVLATATTGTTPALNTRLMDAAPDGPTLGAACHHSAFNIANALGAALGGAVLAAGLGWTAPAAAGALLPLAGLIVLGGSAALERRERQREPVPAG
ncbi:MAG: MFS transporter, partial [Pseudonocardia sediminis]